MNTWVPQTNIRGPVGPGSVIQSDTPPVSPIAGQFWWESDTGILWIWYDDGSSSQWVEVGGSADGTDTAAVIVADMPPDPPLKGGQLWWNSTTGNLYAWFEDADSSQWVQVNMVPGEGWDSPFVTPQMFGGIGDGTADDTTAIHTALASGKAVFLPEGIYKVGQLVIPANSVVRASQLAVIRSNGTATGMSQYVLDIGNGTDFDVLNVSVPGTETSNAIIRLGDNVRGDLLRLTSDVQLGFPTSIRGVLTRGQDVRVGRIETVKIDYCLDLFNPDVTPTTGTEIGFVDCVSYRRALYIINCSASIGGVRTVVRSPTASGSDANTLAILIGGCTDLNIGNCWIEDAGEHTIRVGGSYVAGTQTKNLRIGNITAIRSPGCILKLNPTLLVSPGITETCDNVQIGNILAVDCGLGVGGGNKEILRFTHVRDVQVGDVLAVADEYSTSGQYGLLINDARNVQIASLGGPFMAGAVYIQSWWDTDEVLYFGGDVLGLRIDRLHGTCPGVNAIAVDARDEAQTKTFNVADVHIHFDGFSGWTTRLIWWLGGTLTGVFRMTGWLGGAVSPVYQTMPNTDNCQIDLTWNGKRLIGRAANIANAVAPEAALHMTTAGASLGEVRGRGLLLNAIEVTSALNAYGGAIEFTRVGSGRRGAAIVQKQTGASQSQTGVAVWVGNGVAASDALLEHAIFKHTGDLNLPLIHTHADNAAAIAGGHVVGDIYKTATGELRIVV